MIKYTIQKWHPTRRVWYDMACGYCTTRREAERLVAKWTKANPKQKLRVIPARRG